jgi:uncharacterized membrane protein
MASEKTIPQHFASQIRERRHDREARERINVGEFERWLSLAAGGLLALDGIRRFNFAGLLELAAGGALIHRGWTGHCELYRGLGIETADTPHGPRASVAAGTGLKVEHVIIVNRPIAELFTFWRNFENLPRVMRHLESVRGKGGRSHWVTRGPVGMKLEWDAEIVNEKVDELIAWRSLPGSAVSTAGSVHFRTAPGGATEIQIVLKYDPPAGRFGAAFARLLGDAPEQQIRADLRSFKQYMETGALPMHSRMSSFPG